MLSDLQLAGRCRDAYAPDGSALVVGDTVALLRSVDGERVVAVQGTRSPGEVLRDLEVEPLAYPGLGRCHAGFLRGALALYPAVTAFDPDVVTGHSLGGSIAVLLSALLCWYAPRAGRRCVAFEPARTTLDPDLGRVLADVPTRLYRNGNDPVPEVPVGLPLLPWRHPVPLTPVGVVHLDPLRAHAIDDVIAALQGHS